MSFISRPERRATVSDPRALRALAHPLRLALLDHLMAFGPRTASECAEVVGSTASNCSYHLRALAKFGLVERVDAEDGRERPWQTTATGLAFGRTEDPAFRLGADTTERFLADHQVDEEAARAHRALAQRDDLPEEWREASTLAGYALRMSAAELSELGEQLDALIRPYIALTRTDAPADSAIVALSLSAFRHPDEQPGQRAGEQQDTQPETQPDTRSAEHTEER